jgi:betaine-aldehyde dehydrogenase
VYNEQSVPLTSPHKLFIGGEWVDPSTDHVFDVVRPADEVLYYRVAAAEAPDVRRAVAAARSAFDNGPWPRMSHAERAPYLRAIAAAVRRRGLDISASWASEMGIVYSAAQGRIPRIARTYERYADLAGEFPFVERHAPTAGGQLGLLVREPVGVVAAIIPWNAPMTLMTHKLAPALLAGCTVIVKPAPEAPGSAYIMAEIAQEVGLPAGVLNVITAGREVSELLVRDNDVDKIAFTGSTASGRRIAAICGERIARVTLELGGKSAAVVLDDYDVGAAAASLASSAVHMSGQVCSSLTRIIVGRKQHDDLVDALSQTFSMVQIGDPFDPTTDMGPLAMHRQLRRVEHLISLGRQEGAKLAAGGGRPAHLPKGYFIEPTVFASVDNGSTIAREEIFGPVLSVIPADDEAHAIDLANDTIYGLNASVFTNDNDRALEVARRLRSGTVGHNSFRTDFGIAFGGFKQSGLGREGGREGLLAYLETKTIILDGDPTDLDGDQSDP